jgi:hypothetical protein
MQRHAINSVAVVESGQRGSSDAGGASGLHAAGHAVKLDGKRNSRNAAAAHAAGARTARSTPDAGTAWPINLPKHPHSAGPRAARAPAPSQLARPWRSPNVPAAGPGNAGSVHAVAVAPAALCDTAVPPANVATGGPLLDTVGCNSAGADGTAGKTGHIPSAGKRGNSIGEVDHKRRLRDTPMGPREVSLPQVKPRRRAANSTPGRSYWHSGSSIAMVSTKSQEQTGSWPR